MICLTFDTDWMSATSMSRWLDAHALPGKATFFLWRAMPEVAWGEHELGPHPLSQRGDEWADELDALTEAMGVTVAGVRSHSCYFSHMAGVAMRERGLRYCSMATPLYQQGLRPYRHPWVVWELPIYYMDNMDFCMARNWPDIGHTPFDISVIERAVNGEGLYVFDFHPLHIALNTPDLDTYQQVKGMIHDGRRCPLDCRFEGRGVGDFFGELRQAMVEAGVAGVTCSEALDAFESAELIQGPSARGSSLDRAP